MIWASLTSRSQTQIVTLLWSIFGASWRSTSWSSERPEFRPVEVQARSKNGTQQLLLVVVGLDYMFGILKNYHCWRFHALAWCRDFEIVDLVLFCTKIDYLWVLKGPEYASVFLILFENTESIPFIDGELYMQCVLPWDFTIKTVDELMHRSSLERGGIRWRIFIHMQYCSCWLVLLCYM